jgi:hypothetical protein
LDCKYNGTSEQSLFQDDKRGRAEHKTEDEGGETDDAEGKKTCKITTFYTVSIPIFFRKAS